MSRDVMPVPKEPPPDIQVNASISSCKSTKATRALYDTGADDMTTNDPFIIHHLRLLPKNEWTTLFDAGKKAHFSQYGGESKLILKSGKIKVIRMRLTMTMSITVVDPTKLKDPSKTCTFEGQIVDHDEKQFSHVCRYDDGTTEMIPLTQYKRTTPNIERYYTEPFVRVEDSVKLLYIKAGSVRDIARLSSSDISPCPQIQIRSRLNNETTRILWHHRLGHINDDALSTVHKLVTGVPQITPRTSLDKCPTCMKTKIKKTGKLKSSFRTVSDIKADKNAGFFQHLQIDIGIIVLRSKNEGRVKRLCAHNGDSLYVVIQCLKTDYVFGSTSSSKEPAIKWIHFLLTRFCNWKAREKTFRMDCGGETGYSHTLSSLLQSFQYKNETTGPDNSSANGKIERFNGTVKGGIRSLITAVDWTSKVWNFAFYHYVRIYNSTPHAHGVPYTNVTGKLADLSLMRIFGCPVTVLKNGTRPALEDHSRHGRFAGYDGTMKKILYFPKGKSSPLEATNVVFDELFSSWKTVPPVVQDLRRAMGREEQVLDACARRQTGVQFDLDIVTENEQFAKIREIIIIPSGDRPLGIKVEIDVATNRGYISDVLPGSLITNVRNWRIEVIGSFITRVNDDIVFTKETINEELSRAMDDQETFTITIATDMLDPLPKAKQLPIPRLQLDQLRHIDTIRSAISDSETREDGAVPIIGFISDDSIQDSDYAIATDLPLGEENTMTIDIYLAEEYSFDDPVDVPLVASTQAKDLTSKTSQFSRRKLKQTPEWSDWLAAEWKQLDAMVKDDMFGEAVLRSDLDPDTKCNVMRVVWNYAEKLHTLMKKARVCGDGRGLRPKHKSMQKSYAACASNTGLRMHIAIAAYENRLMFATDADNAYAQSGPLDILTLLEVDDAIREWYYERYKVLLPRGSLLKLKSSIQGHPDAGVNWQKKVDTSLEGFGWRKTIHEPCLYRRDMGDKSDQLMCRQVDDMLLSLKTKEEFLVIASELDTVLNMTHENKLATCFNGLEIEQTRDYIGIGVEKYIVKVYTDHGWDAENISKKPKAPLSELLAKEIIESDKGPQSKSPAAIALQNEMGFSYRMLLGELIWAYVIVRLDIGYAMSLLSRYAEYPAKVHYTGLKSVTRYLRETKDRQIIYWRKEPLIGLPPGTFVPYEIPPDVLYPFPPDPYLVTADVDASHATDIASRRSTGGHIVMIFAAAVLWQAKLQATMATSSTESEFMQAVTACKGVLFIRHIMNELRRMQKGPSPINEDNMACIMMVNQRRPTTRTRHIDIQWFAIQQWKEEGKIIMQYISTHINSADATTKALGWVLHNKHSFRSMGLYGSPYSYGKQRITAVKNTPMEGE